MSATHDSVSIRRIVLSRTNEGRLQLVVGILPFESQFGGSNFTENSKHYMVRCYTCKPNGGRENYGSMVASGTCAWCGDSMYRERPDPNAI